MTPASTLKMLTTTAALEALGPDHRFTTRVVATPSSPRITLVGGGDPLLGRDASDPDGTYPARADLDTLARATARALRGLGRSRVRLGYDASLFTGPSVNPHWEPSYVPDGVVSPISAAVGRRGTGPSGLACRSPDPAAAAGAGVRAGAAPARDRGDRQADGRRRADRGRRRPGHRLGRRAPRWPRSSSTCSRSATTRAPRCCCARWRSPSGSPRRSAAAPGPSGRC